MDDEEGGGRRGLLIALVLLLVLLVPALLALGAGLAWYAGVHRPAPRPVAEAPDQPVPEPTPVPAEPAPPEPAPPQPTPKESPAPAPVEPAPVSVPAVAEAPSSSPRASTPRAEARPKERAETTPSATSPAEDKEAAPSEALVVEVQAPRRSLRNATLHATVNTGQAGCDVTVHWRAEGSGSWAQATLPGGGPVHTWSMDVTAEHRPAILYHVSVTGCGEGSAHSEAQPGRIAVL